MATLRVTPATQSLPFQLVQGVQQGAAITLYLFVSFDMFLKSPHTLVPSHLFAFERVVPHATDRPRHVMGHIPTYVDIIRIFGPFNKIFVAIFPQMSGSHIDHLCDRFFGRLCLFASNKRRIYSFLKFCTTIKSCYMYNH